MFFDKIFSDQNEPFPAPEHFAGRQAERHLLSAWLNGDGAHTELGQDAKKSMLFLTAPNGMGKSTLAWHWLTSDVIKEVSMFGKTIWWSFYDEGATFERFVSQGLDYFRRNNILQKHESELIDATTEFCDILCNQKYLIIMDGIERLLKAYAGFDSLYKGDAFTPDEQQEYRRYADTSVGSFLRRLANPACQSKILLTTCLFPLELDELDTIKNVKLQELPLHDAICLFHECGVKGSEADIERVCGYYGYYPLCLKLIIYMILNNPGYDGNIEVWLKANRITEFKDNHVHGIHKILELFYRSLEDHSRELISILAASRHGINYQMIESIVQGILTRNDGDNDYQKALQELDAHYSIAEKNNYGRLKEECIRQKSRLENSLVGNHYPTLAGILDDNQFDTELKKAIINLNSRHLLSYSETSGKYNMHPVVRKYCYKHLSNTETVHSILAKSVDIQEKDKIRTLTDTMPFVEKFHHLVKAGLLLEAISFYDSYLQINGKNKTLNHLLTREFQAYDVHAELVKCLLDTAGSEPLPRYATYLMMSELRSASSDRHDIYYSPSTSRLPADTAQYSNQSRKLKFLNTLAADLSLIGRTTEAVIAYGKYLSLLLQQSPTVIEEDNIMQSLERIETEINIIFHQKKDDLHSILWAFWFSKNIAIFARNLGMSIRPIGKHSLAFELFTFYNRILSILISKTDLSRILINRFIYESIWSSESSIDNDIIGTCYASIKENNWGEYFDLVGVGNHELARLCCDSGKFSDAEEHLAKFREILDFFGSSFAYAWEHLEDWSSFKESISKKLEQAEGLLAGKIHLYWAYMAYYTVLKASDDQADFQSALEYAKKALEYAEKTPSNGFQNRNLVRSWYLIGRCLNDMELNDEAMPLIDQAVALTRKYNMVDFESGIMLEQAICYQGLGQSSKALEGAKQALNTAIRYRFICQEADAHSFLAHYYECAGDTDKAAWHTEIAHLRARQTIDCNTGDYIAKKDDKWHYKVTRYGG